MNRDFINWHCYVMGSACEQKFGNSKEIGQSPCIKDQIMSVGIYFNTFYSKNCSSNKTL